MSGVCAVAIRMRSDGAHYCIFRTAARAVHALRLTLPWRGRVGANESERRGGVTLPASSCFELHPTPACTFGACPPPPPQGGGVRGWAPAPPPLKNFSL